MTVALAPVMIILGSVRPLSWLRGLWSKAFVVFLLLLPINVLTMGVALKFWVSALSLASGPLASILQLTILAGTLSVLIAVNGTLGKLVYGAAIEVAQKVGKTLTSVASMAAGLAVGAVGVGALGGSALGGGAAGLAPALGGGGGSGAGQALSSASSGGVVTSTSNLTSTIGRTLSGSRSSAISSLGKGMTIGAAVKEHKTANQPLPSSQLDIANKGVPGQAKGVADVMGQIDTPQKAATIGADQATLANRVTLGAETSAATLEAVEAGGLSARDYLRDTNYHNPGRPDIEMAGRDFIRSEAGSFALGGRSSYTQTALPGATPNTTGIHSLDYQAAHRIVQSEQRYGSSYFNEISASKIQDVAQAVRARRVTGMRSYDAIVNNAKQDHDLREWIDKSKGLLS